MAHPIPFPYLAHSLQVYFRDDEKAPDAPARPLCILETAIRCLRRRGVLILTAKNLKIALEDYDRSPLAHADGAAAERFWLVSHLFRLFSREIEYCVNWDRPWPPFMWQELHDLYFYLYSRKDLALDPEGTGPAGAYDAEQEYKRLLLLGLVKLLVRPGDRSPMLIRGLPAWAEMSELKEIGAFAGTFDLFVVEIFSDEPPRQHAGALDAGFNGWVLQPAQGFLDYVAGISATA